MKLEIDLSAASTKDLNDEVKFIDSFIVQADSPTGIFQAVRNLILLELQKRGETYSINVDITKIKTSNFISIIE